MKLFKVYTSNPMSDYWKMIITAETEAEAKEIAGKYCSSSTVVSTIEEIMKPGVIEHDSYKY